MTTLADVNDRLGEQNAILEDVNTGISSLSSGLKKFVAGFTKQSDREKLNDLEDKYEKKQGVAQRAKIKERDDGKGSNKQGLLGGLLSNLSGALLPAGLTAAAAAALLSGILKRGALAVIGGTIIDALTDELIDDPETKSIVAGAFKGGLLAQLFLGRFRIIGAILGGIFGGATDKQMEELEANAQKLADNMGPTITKLRENLEKLLGINISTEAVINEINEDLTALNNLLDPDSKTNWYDDLSEIAAWAAGIFGYSIYRIRKWRKGKQKQKIDENLRTGTDPTELDPADVKRRNPTPTTTGRKEPVFEEPAKPKIVTKSSIPTGSEVKHNGKTYRWMGQAWGEVGKNGNVGKSAPKSIATELNKKAASVVDDLSDLRANQRMVPQAPVKGNWLSRLFRAGGPLALGLTPNTTAGPELDEIDPNTAPSVFDDPSYMAQFNANKKPSTAGILTEQAEVYINNATLSGVPAMPTIVDQSTTVNGGSASTTIALPVQRTSDITGDPKSR